MLEDVSMEGPESTTHTSTSHWYAISEDCDGHRWAITKEQFWQALHICGVRLCYPLSGGGGSQNKSVSPTDGLVERFNQTLKAMLRKAAVEKGKDWDKMIPYLLIAYREVPQASTGFSPFELLYGRAVHGPLDVLRQTWEVDRKTDESVVSHILSIAIRDKMEKMQDCSVYCFG